ncbi:MAG TPA: LLM class flavin-dependent oxidoreductase [Acetobacteraceae bacterium]|nr:LLM class flavin-dependent oxidoreductase [Acetobacteraceae bacterium]
MEFGMFHEFQRAPGQSEAAAFADGFALVDAAEEWGLDAMWLAELHVAPDRSVLAAPLTIASAIAARTKRMKIGIAVQVLPLCHPLRLAEEAATVDHISNGRLIFGVGRSGFPRTYEAYGISYAESRERFAEVLEILRRAWSQERFSYAGKFYRFENVCLVPKPLQRPWPELRIAATSADTYAAIGAMGYPIFCAVRLGTLSELAPSLKAYRDAYQAAGHPGRGEVFLRVPVYLAETKARARAEPEESIMLFYRYLGAQLEDSANRAGARAVEQRAERGQRLQTIDYDEVLREKIIVGTPDAVVARLRALQEELGLDGILAEMNCGGRIPKPQVTRSLELLCREVMPSFGAH